MSRGKKSSGVSWWGDGKLHGTRWCIAVVTVSLACVFLCPIAAAGSRDAAGYLPTDVDHNGTTDAVDVQLSINGALGIGTSYPTDVDGANGTDAVDVQLVINGALGIVSSSATIDLTPGDATIGSTGSLYLTAMSSDSNDTIQWTSLEPQVATVDSAGGVVAVAPGVARIRATGDTSGAASEALVTVNAASLDVTPSTLIINESTSQTLSVTSSSTGDSIDFASADTGIATVGTGGKVTGKAVGDTTVTVTSQDTGLEVDVAVTVVPAGQIVPGPGRAITKEVVSDNPWDPGVNVTLDDGKEFMLEDIADAANYNKRIPDLGTAKHNKGVVTVPTSRPSARYVSLAADQTSIKNQQDRNTCTRFAIIAGIEAAYKRAGYGDLDLSEQYFNHLGKTTWLHPFEGESRPRGVWESQLGLTAGGGVYGVALLMRYGLPPESDAIYRHSNQFPYAFGDYGNIRQTGDNPYIMSGLTRQDVTQREMDDFNLEDTATTWQIPGNYTFTPLSNTALTDAQYGVTGYQICPAGRVHDISWWENVLAMGYEIEFQCNVYDDVVDGVWVARDMQEGDRGGSHAMCMVGYDRRDPAHPYFIVKNQWGESNFIKLDYGWVTHTYDGTMTNAVFITGIADPSSQPYKAQAALGRWTVETDLYSDPATLDIFRQSAYFDSSELNGYQDRRVGELYDVSGNPYKVNGFAFPNFLQWYLDFSNPNADYDATGGNEFFGYFNIADPTLMAGYYQTTGGETYGFYGHKGGTINSRSLFTSLGSDDVFLGRWEIIHPEVEGWVEVTSVGHASHGIAVTYEDASGSRVSYGGTGDYTTRDVSIPLDNYLIANGGNFVGHILATNPGILAGYLDPTSGVRSGMVLRRVNYASLDVQINKPVNGESFVVGDTVGLHAITTGDGMNVSSPGSVIWSIDAPYDEGGTYIAEGKDTTWMPDTPGTYNVFAVYTENSLSGPDKRAQAQVTVTVNDAQAPTVTITSPTDGTTFDPGYADPAIVTVTFTGEATDTVDGTFAGADLHWSYRVQGDSSWSDAGTGSQISLDLMDTVCFDYTYYEVRLQATNTNNLTGTDIITVGVNALFCK